jgi:hypothetical protein
MRRLYSVINFGVSELSEIDFLFAESPMLFAKKQVWSSTYEGINDAVWTTEGQSHWLGTGCQLEVEWLLPLVALNITASLRNSTHEGEFTLQLAGRRG